MVNDVKTRLGAGRLERLEPPVDKAVPLATDELHDMLERIIAWDVAAWNAHRERYEAAYDALPFLPPECQNAVVVQATVGSRSGVTFGGSPAREPYARSPAELARHAGDVAALWGRRLSQSRVVFLAGSDVLHQPFADVTAYLDAINSTFPMSRPGEGESTPQGNAAEMAPRFEGAHAFIDDFLPPLPDRAGWAELARRGLRRVSLGVESGDPALRAAYRKAWSDADLVASLKDLKSAGIGVSVLTLVGAGGVEGADSHVNQTARLIESLELSRGDFVFLLDENELREPGDNLDGLTPLQGPSWLAEQAMLKHMLAPLKQRGVKVLPYSLTKQWT
jgi:hypothetical protein